MRSFFHSLKKFIGLWPALTWATIPMLFLAFFSEAILRYLDPTVEPITVGMIQVVFIIILVAMLLTEAAFGAVRFNFKHLFNYYSGDSSICFKNDLKTINPWQRLKLFLLVLALFLLPMFLLAALMLGVV